MGLDITAHEKVTFVETIERPEDWCEKYDDAEEDYIYTGKPTFAQRIEPMLENGVYLCGGETFGFRAGSYIGYNLWRNWLCKTVLDVPADVVWNNRQDYQDKPFYPLIDFSDCEGELGATCCARLAKDFGEFEAKMKHANAPDAWYFQKYLDWKRAFEIAANGGCVEFH